MKIWRTALIGGLVGLGLCGCDEPTDIIPVSPPGAVIPRVSPDADPAQALGESAPSSSTTTAKATPAKSAKIANMKPAPPTAKGETKTTEGGVKYETLKEGTGPALQPGQKASLHYVGTLESGIVFDSSRGKGTPFEVAIGASPLIKGWEEAIPGMKVGELRKLTIPPTMGYGPKGSGKIPPDATLIFEVELLALPDK